MKDNDLPYGCMETLQHWLCDENGSSSLHIHAPGHIMASPESGDIIIDRLRCARNRAHAAVCFRTGVILLMWWPA